MPIASFDDSDLDSPNDEMVAVVEGVVYPWFGVAYRIDRVQFGIDSSFDDLTDHSREAISHAQKIANLFVDEARLSSNEYDFVIEEVEALQLITDNDAYFVKLPLAESLEFRERHSEVYFF